MTGSVEHTIIRGCWRWTEVSDWIGNGRIEHRIIGGSWWLIDVSGWMIGGVEHSMVGGDGVVHGGYR